MVGFIDDKATLLKLGLIWREFGPRCAARCLTAVIARKHVTFLDVVFETVAKQKPRGRKNLELR
jgi:hypothetical protein